MTNGIFQGRHRLRNLSYSPGSLRYNLFKIFPLRFLDTLSDDKTFLELRFSPQIRYYIDLAICLLAYHFYLCNRYLCTDTAIGLKNCHFFMIKITKLYSFLSPFWNRMFNSTHRHYLKVEYNF